MDSTERLEAVAKLVNNLKQSYPTARKMKIDICFEWLEPKDIDIESALCPKVQIEIEQ